MQQPVQWQQPNAKKLEAVNKLSAHARDTLTNDRDNAISCKEVPYLQFCENWEGHVPPVPHSSCVHSQMPVMLSK